MIAELGSAIMSILTTANVITAIGGGMLAGWYIVGRSIEDPVYVSPSASERDVSLLVVGYSIAIGLVFYAGQAVAALIDGDPAWARVTTRFIVWIVFAIGLGVGLKLRLRHHAKRRRREAADTARRRLGD